MMTVMESAANDDFYYADYIIECIERIVKHEHVTVARLSPFSRLPVFILIDIHPLIRSLFLYWT